VRISGRLVAAAALAVCVSLHLLAGPARAIVVCDDPNDPNHLVTPPSAYDEVAYLGTADGTSAVLIDSWYILTARHAGYVPGMVVFHLAGGQQVFTMMEKFSNPSADLAVIRLNRATGLPGYSLYDPAVYGSEKGKEGILLGYGMSGTPATVQAGGDPNYPRGTLRVGYNKIDGNAFDPNAGYYLWSDFDSPSSPGPNGSLGINKEAAVALGDSGGPLFINAGGQLRVAGIEFSSSRNDPNHWPSYGDYSYYVQVAAYSSWIKSLIPSQPATETGDFNNDGATNDVDIDALFGHYGGIDMWYDLTGDSAVGKADSDRLIRVFLTTEYGDADLDHRVDVNDYNILAANFGLTGSGHWALGDFNGDKKVDFADYQILEVSFGFGTGGGLSLPPVPVPEPAAMSLLAAGWVLLGRRAQKR